MTVNKSLKRLIRARMKQTGESYSTARRFFLRSEENKNMSDFELKTVTNNDYGFTLDVPVDWHELEPDLNNGPFEIARINRDTEDSLYGSIAVFKPQPGDPRSVAELNKADLATKDFDNLEVSELVLSGRSVAQLTCDKPKSKRRSKPHSPVQHHWVRSYFIPVGSHLFVVGLSTPDPEVDKLLFDKVAASFNAIEDRAGIVFEKSTNVTMTFMRRLLEDAFGYTQNRALRKAVAIDAQGESIVAIVERKKADEVVMEINARAKSAGVPFGCRTVEG